MVQMLLAMHDSDEGSNRDGNFYYPSVEGEMLIISFKCTSLRCSRIGEVNEIHNVCLGERMNYKTSAWINGQNSQLISVFSQQAQKNKSYLSKTNMLFSNKIVLLISFLATLAVAAPAPSPTISKVRDATGPLSARGTGDCAHGQWQCDGNLIVSIIIITLSESCWQNGISVTIQQCPFPCRCYLPT